ncbi:hypothetical protein [Myxococcus stipitatus]|uniref:hypothetical protein n=1 Tax=Myxococcus stipitatus TaxID=83455 RepID=UPI0030CAA838
MGLLYVSRMLHAAPTDPVAPIQKGLAQAGDVRQVGEHAYEVATTKSLIEKLAQLDESPALQARIVPAFVEGKSQGFKLFAIRPDSVYDRLGFQNGDIIQRVNGHALDSPQKAMEAYDQMKDVRHVEVDMLRDGLALRKVYDLK